MFPLLYPDKSKNQTHVLDRDSRLKCIKYNLFLKNELFMLSYFQSSASARNPSCLRLRIASARRSVYCAYSLRFMRYRRSAIRSTHTNRVKGNYMEKSQLTI